METLRQVKKIKLDKSSLVENSYLSYFSRPTKVEFCDKSRCFRVNGRVISGLIPKLKELFWSTYEYKKQKYVKYGGERDVYGGLVRGTIVHNQLRMYGNRCSEDEFKSQYVSLHEFTEKAIKALKIWKFKPIRSEYPVCDTKFLGVATAIDMICLNSSGKLILIEWKCGMANYFQQGNNSMDGPLKNLNNCPLNQAYLQLLFTKAIFEKQHNISIEHSYVVQITKKKVVPYELPQSLIQQQNALYNYVFINLDYQRKTKLFQNSVKRKYRQ